ncbi:hypothetical protein DJ62_3620 [Yersinia enterocolitica]|nr:hypothetical protein DJ62_3620 [Yersinia enterocolitica]
MTFTILFPPQNVIVKINPMVHSMIFIQIYVL